MAVRTVRTVLLGMMIAVPATAQTIATQRDDYASSAGARGITVADLNRDGWLDIITAHHDPDGLEILTNRGAAGGYDKGFVPLGVGPFDVAAADLNKDGFPDLAVADADGNTIVLLLSVNGSGGSAREFRSMAAPGNPRGVTVADVDRDGNLDVIYTAFQSAGVQVLYGDGKGAFASRFNPVPVGANPQGLASADFNEDGWPDLVVASSGSGLSILYQVPSAPGTFTRADLSVPLSQNVVGIADLNRDGRPDIATASTGNSTVTVVLNRPTGFTAHTYPSGGGSPRGIAVADLNRDGAPDIVTGNRSTSTVEILPNTGDGTFGAAYGFAAGSGARTVAVGDFNNDGKIDIASGNEYAYTATVLSNVTTFPRSAYAFHRATMGPGGNGYGGPAGSAVADFDLDGKPDVVTLGANNGAIVLLGNGGSTPIPTNVIPSGITAATINRDGYPDVLLVDANATTQQAIVKAYLGKGDGTFPTVKETPTSLVAWNIAVADLNQDGRLDFVLAGNSTPGYNADTYLQSWLGNGDGTFTLAWSFAIQRTSTHVSLGDVDRDGHIDAVAYINSGYSTGHATVYTWHGDGTGRFTGPSSLNMPYWSGIYGGELGDVNHDGYLDYVASGTGPGDYRAHGLGVMLGGPSGFAAPIDVPTPDYYSGIPHLADMTLDGNVDIVTEVGGIYAGNGDGTFKAPDRFDFTGFGLTILDFDRNGLPDVVAPDSNGSAQLILNQHDDTNHPPTVDAGPDFSERYDYQFGDGDQDRTIVAADPDLHLLTFTVFDAQGKVVQQPTTDTFYYLPLMNPGTYQYTVQADDGRGGTARDSITVTVTPLKEIVIHTTAQYPYFAPDKWSAVTDPTAASGAAVHDRNDGAPKVTAPLVSPASYTMISFIADPTQTYKLWVRLKADNDYWANDSFWLQFSRDAVDQNGNSYAFATTSGIAVNLEECSGCGESGWGWRDESWGQKDIMGTMTLRFPTGGWQTLYMQTREDGVSVDQIVLSAEKYRTTRPGTTKNDTVILPWTPFY